MFEGLTDTFEGIFGRLSKKGKLSEADVDEALREIRLALLEADVNVRVVKALRNRIKERAVGEEVHNALNPAQQVVKIVNEELTQSLGGESFTLKYNAKPPTVVMMAGLQGSGKTTTSGKLAKWFKAQGRNPILVGADLQRPAAVQQLQTLGEQVGVPVFSDPSTPVEVARKSIEEAKRTGRDVVIIDTAGRLAIDEALMEEVRQIAQATVPDYIFLVVDAMTGNDAVTVAESFNTSLELDGVILTKLDGDARGGAALSVKEVVGKPIAFAATGEKLDALEIFHPDRMASRILGMGDVLSLIEKAEQHFEQEEAEAAAQAMMDGRFTFDDFLDQMQQLKKMGSLSSLIGMLPGIPKEVRNMEIDDREIGKVEAIIRSMTTAERMDPKLIDTSRKKRIANGSGTDTVQVDNLVKQFDEMQKMMKKLGGMGTKKAKGGRKGKKTKGKGGGRVTPKGGAAQLPGNSRVTPKGTKARKSPLMLPGMDRIAEIVEDD
ncbi:MAG: signal recognition particle protein [Acidimicrobiales bacterium]|nr:signal recognition particle protein [Acidimicrobiales bacterium]